MRRNHRKNIVKTDSSLIPSTAPSLARNHFSNSNTQKLCNPRFKCQYIAPDFNENLGSITPTLTHPSSENSSSAYSSLAGQYKLHAYSFLPQSLTFMRLLFWRVSWWGLRESGEDFGVERKICRTISGTPQHPRSPIRL